MATGTPPLLKQAGGVVNYVTLLAADALAVYKMFTPSQWGVYISGSSVPIFVPLTVAGQIGISLLEGASYLGLSLGANSMPDSIVALDYKHEWRISDAPMELGAFESYNKVQVPFSNRVRMAKSGTKFDKAAFLQTLEAMAATTTVLFDIVTPEYTYVGVSIQSFTLSRNATEGTGMLLVDVEFVEIRQTVSTSLSNTSLIAAPTPDVQTGYVGR